uniref:Uncharacterized protein n=1 Tax=Papilio xuthus TaxID=66420 RepID=I4DQQ4_PAPXU|nr:unknown unsecreted protein [Papilio xuthus]
MELTRLLRSNGSPYKVPMLRVVLVAVSILYGSSVIYICISFKALLLLNYHKLQ